MSYFESATWATWCRAFVRSMPFSTLTTSFLEALIDGLMTVAMLAVMAYYSLLLCAVVVGAAVLYCCLLRWLSSPPPRHPGTNRLAGQGANPAAGVHPRRAGHQTIRPRGAAAQPLAQRVGGRNQPHTHHPKAGPGPAKHAPAAGALENVLVVWLGAGLVLDGQFSVGHAHGLHPKTTFAQRVHALVDKVELVMLRVWGERLADIVWAGLNRKPKARWNPTTPRSVCTTCGFAIAKTTLGAAKA